MNKAIRIAVGVLMTLTLFGGLMYLFIYEVFRFNYGHIRGDVFNLVAVVVFVCSAFLVSVAWQAVCNRFLKKRASRKS
jgi:hypothetical protein